MTQPRTEHQLSTADMVSATEGPRPNEPRDATAMPPEAGATMTPRPAQAERPDQPEEAAAQTGTAETPLVPAEQGQSYRSRWEEIQTGFVDEPRQAVEQADHLVAEVIKRVA